MGIKIMLIYGNINKWTMNINIPYKWIIMGQKYFKKFSGDP